MDGLEFKWDLSHSPRTIRRGLSRRRKLINPGIYSFRRQKPLIVHLRAPNKTQHRLAPPLPVGKPAVRPTPAPRGFC